jgi:hypothetical protein
MATDVTVPVWLLAVLVALAIAAGAGAEFMRVNAGAARAGNHTPGRGRLSVEQTRLRARKNPQPHPGWYPALSAEITDEVVYGSWLAQPPGPDRRQQVIERVLAGLHGL